MHMSCRCMLELCVFYSAASPIHAWSRLCLNLYCMWADVCVCTSPPPSKHEKCMFFMQVHIIHLLLCLMIPLQFMNLSRLSCFHRPLYTLGSLVFCALSRLISFLWFVVQNLWRVWFSLIRMPCCAHDFPEWWRFHFGFVMFVVASLSDRSDISWLVRSRGGDRSDVYLFLDVCRCVSISCWSLWGLLCSSSSEDWYRKHPVPWD